MWWKSLALRIPPSSLGEILSVKDFHQIHFCQLESQGFAISHPCANSSLIFDLLCLSMVLHQFWVDEEKGGNSKL